MSAIAEPGTTGLTTWKIDPSHTLVEFAGKHMMFTTVKGRFAVVDGTIRVHDQDPTQSSVEAVLDAASVATGDARRDDHLRSPDFLDAATYPTIAFRSTRVERAGEDRLKVEGDLTIRDVTRPVVLDVEVQGQGKNPFGKIVAGFSAQTQINRKDWGLSWNVALEAGGLLVGDQLKISLEVQAVRED